MKAFFRCVECCRNPVLPLVAAALLVVPCGAAVPDAKELAARREFNAAAELHNSGLYERAVKKWVAFAQKYPNYSRLDRVHYCLGLCQAQTKKYPEAIKTFQTVLTKYPNFADLDGAQYQIGMAYFKIASASKKAEDFKTAATALGAVADKYPTSKHAQRALFFQGESLCSGGDLKAAVDAYKKLIANHKKSSLLPGAYYSLGIAQQELGLDSDAAATFQAFLADQTLAKHELAGEIRLRLGMSLFNQKKYEDAEKHFAGVAAIPNFAAADFALLRQGQCQLESGKMAEAAALFAQLPTKFPTSEYKARAQLAAGICYCKLDKLEDAQKAFFETIAKFENEPSVAHSIYEGSLAKLRSAYSLLHAIESTHPVQLPVHTLAAG